MLVCKFPGGELEHVCVPVQSCVSDMRISCALALGGAGVSLGPKAYDCFIGKILLEWWGSVVWQSQQSGMRFQIPCLELVMNLHVNLTLVILQKSVFLPTHFNMYIFL